MSDQFDIEVTLDKWAYGGEAMGRLEDGRVIFIPDTIPLEKVRTRIIENKKGYARGVLVEVLEASPLRITPKCEYFGVCNGCSYQHLNGESQQRLKADILENQLSRIANIDVEVITSTSDSLTMWGFLDKAIFFVDEDGKLNFSDRYKREFIPAKNCPLLSPELANKVEKLNFPDIPDLAQVQIRIGNEDSDLLILDSFSDDPFEFETDFPISVVQAGPQTTHILSDRFFQEELFGEHPIRISAGSNSIFSSKNISTISNLILENISSNNQLIHIHAGIGLFSISLASHFKSIVAISEIESENEDFIHNLNNFEEIELYEASASQVLPTLKGDSGVIFVSPSDAGINRFDLDAILNYQPPVVVYLSLNPSTLARDAKRMIEKEYKNISIRLLDSQPHSKYIYSLSFWEKK